MPFPVFRPRTNFFDPDKPVAGPGFDAFARTFWQALADRPASKPVILPFIPSGEPPKPIPLATGVQGRTEFFASTTPPDRPMGDGGTISVTGKAYKPGISDTEIAAAVFNETRSLSGDGIDELRRQMAQTIMNADEVWGLKRPDMAGTARTELPPRLNPQEAELFAQIQANVADARERFNKGEDPTNLATNFHMRHTDDKAPPDDARRVFTLQSQHGPFQDARYPGNAQKNAYWNIWKNPEANRYYDPGAYRAYQRGLRSKAPPPR